MSVDDENRGLPFQDGEPQALTTEEADEVASHFHAAWEDESEWEEPTTFMQQPRVPVSNFELHAETAIKASPVTQAEQAAHYPVARDVRPRRIKESAEKIVVPGVFSYQRMLFVGVTGALVLTAGIWMFRRGSEEHAQSPSDTASEPIPVSQSRASYQKALPTPAPKAVEEKNEARPIALPSPTPSESTPSAPPQKVEPAVEAASPKAVPEATAKQPRVERSREETVSRKHVRIETRVEKRIGEPPRRTHVDSKKGGFVTTNPY